MSITFKTFLITLTFEDGEPVPEVREFTDCEDKLNKLANDWKREYIEAHKTDGTVSGSQGSEHKG